MCGMLVASVSQTIVSPAMPIIVAELGGIEHYSWLATAAMLVAAVTTPISGRLGDLFGKRRVALALIGLLVLGSVIAALSSDGAGADSAAKK